MVTLRPEKLCRAPKAEISGVIRSLISACTTALNATPTTTATARSTRLPRRRNFLNPPIHPTLGCLGGAATPLVSLACPARCHRTGPMPEAAATVVSSSRLRTGPSLLQRGRGSDVTPPETFLEHDFYYARKRRHCSLLYSYTAVEKLSDTTSASGEGR